MGLFSGFMETSIYDFVMHELGETSLTYREVADGSGVPMRTVEKVARRETKDPSVSTVQKLADYFRTSKQSNSKQSDALHP